MIYTISDPERLGIFVQSGNWKTLSAIQQATGADVLTNAQMWVFSTGQPCYALRVDGKTLANDAAGWWGFGWNTGEKRLHWDRAFEIDKYDNFLGCEKIVEGGKVLTTPAAYGGSRGRTGLGMLSDGTPVVFCQGDAQPCTVEDMAKALREAGCVYAIMLDGGGSSQAIWPEGEIKSARLVQSVFWATETQSGGDKVNDKGNDTATAEKPAESAVCPYTEPNYSVRKGSTGEGARWVQWQLNRNGAKLIVDGVFGALSEAALMAFQAAHGLTADGVCGASTRALLRSSGTVRAVNGIDCATPLTAVTAKALFDAGKRFAGRYMVGKAGGWKYMSKAEAEIILDSGMAILPIYETTGKRTLGGATYGEVDGKRALECAAEVGLPQGCCIYFGECDFGVSGRQYDLVETYLNAIRAAFGGRYLVGLYGPYGVIEEMYKRHAADRLWQCVGWSGGQISDHADIYQSGGSRTVCGVSVDPDEATGIESAGMWTKASASQGSPQSGEAGHLPSAEGSLDPSQSPKGDSSPQGGSQGAGGSQGTEEAIRALKERLDNLETKAAELTDKAKELREEAENLKVVFDDYVEVLRSAEG